MIILREFTTKDFDDFYKLNCDIIEEKEYFGAEKPFLKEKSLAFRNEQMQANNPMIVAYDDSKFIGWCDIYTDKTNENSFNRHLGIGLDKDYRNKGIGKLLISAVLKLCKQNKIDTVYLVVFKLNQRAINLYTKIGFVHIPSADGSEIHHGVLKEHMVMSFDLTKLV